MKTFKEYFSKSNITIKTLPAVIKAGKYDDLEKYVIGKKSCEYEYSQMDEGDDEDDGFVYYTLTLKVKIVDYEIHVDTKTTNLDQSDKKAFSKKYSKLVFTSVDDFISKTKEIVKAFDKL